MSFTPEDAAKMLAENPDGTFRLNYDIANTWGLMPHVGNGVRFKDRDDAIQTVTMLRLAFHAGQSLALRHVREALGIRT